MDLECSRVGDKDIDVSYDIQSSVPTILIGDPTHLRSIICNLLSNAIKFTHEGDVSVSVSASVVENTQKSQEDCHLSDNTVMLEIEVSDTGVGIPEEFGKHIFEPFSKLSAKTIPNMVVQV
jgi:signal transduction histidine kinase